MVCAVCNGKRYVFENHRELVGNESQGRGECFLGDRDRAQRYGHILILKIRRVWSMHCVRRGCQNEKQGNLK
jgi:hypothetical protein